MAKKKIKTVRKNVSKETMAAEVQHVPYVSRADEIQERIATRNKILEGLNQIWGISKETMAAAKLNPDNKLKEKKK